MITLEILSHDIDLKTTASVGGQTETSRYRAKTMSEPQPHLLILSTCPDSDTASALGETLVGEGLAACVSLVPGLTSIYRWEGAVQRDSEVLLLIKTSGGRFDALSRRLRELHPYDVPEIIAVPIVAGLPDYLTWVTACTPSND